MIVIEQEDGTLACSPFHVRFGKFSLLRPYEKKVEFTVNGEKQPYSMKLGEGGEAFFVFETSDDIPDSLQTSPVVSPTGSPRSQSESELSSSLQEPDYLDLDVSPNASESKPADIPLSRNLRASTDLGTIAPLSRSFDTPELGMSHLGPLGLGSGKLNRSDSEPPLGDDFEVRSESSHLSETDPVRIARSQSPPPPTAEEAMSRAISLSKKLSGSNIPSHVTDTGDLMLDMTGYKSNDEDALRAEVIARKILSEELEGCYDIGSLIGADEHGNLWIYSSEEAKEAANRRATFNAMRPNSAMSENAVTDSGYHSDGDQHIPESLLTWHTRAKSDVQPEVPSALTQDALGEASRNYAKTLRLTSDQLKALNLKPGPNPMSFSVNKATCTATMYLWSGNTPIVISDIDGTITKSDALGHVLNMIGRDWTHAGVAKLYTDIVNNGYNIMYLTSRSVGQADTTRAYIYGVNQDGYRLPKGPTIMSPDRTLAALRREVYLRKPEVFKMACLRDILGLFNGKENPFYAGFGNRLTDALSYRSVNIPSSRIFTINSNAEVSLDLLSLNQYKSSYVTMRELLDHFFPPVSLLVQAGGEDFTDFTYWRDLPPDLEDFSSTDSEDEEQEDEEQEEDEEEHEEEEMDEEEEDEEADEEDEGDDYELSGDEGSEVFDDDEPVEEDLGASYVSQASADQHPPDPSIDGHSVALEDDQGIEADDEVEPPEATPKPVKSTTLTDPPSPSR